MPLSQVSTNTLTLWSKAKTRGGKKKMNDLFSLEEPPSTWPSPFMLLPFSTQQQLQDTTRSSKDLCFAFQSNTSYFLTRSQKRHSASPANDTAPPAGLV